MQYFLYSLHYLFHFFPLSFDYKDIFQFFKIYKRLDFNLLVWIIRDYGNLFYSANKYFGWNILAKLRSNQDIAFKNFFACRNIVQINLFIQATFNNSKLS